MILMRLTASSEMTNIFKHGMAFTWLVTEGTGYDRYFQSCENLN